MEEWKAPYVIKYVRTWEVSDLTGSLQRAAASPSSLTHAMQASIFLLAAASNYTPCLFNLLLSSSFLATIDQRSGRVPARPLADDPSMDDGSMDSIIWHCRPVSLWSAASSLLLVYCRPPKPCSSGQS
nr:unnamed protein product [Digitaria exilis]